MLQADPGTMTVQNFLFLGRFKIKTPCNFPSRKCSLGVRQSCWPCQIAPLRGIMQASLTRKCSKAGMRMGKLPARIWRFVRQCRITLLKSTLKGKWQKCKHCSQVWNAQTERLALAFVLPTCHPDSQEGKPLSPRDFPQHQTLSSRKFCKAKLSGIWKTVASRQISDGRFSKLKMRGTS